MTALTTLGLVLAGVVALGWLSLYGDRDSLAPAILGSAVALLPERERVRQALSTAFEAHGMPGALGEALGWVESRWRLDALNQSGPDGARGGAWGPTQITERTARGYGYTGFMQDFREDPEIAAEWSGIIMAKRPGGPPQTAEDAGAWWNAGRATYAALPEGHVTRTEYVPRLADALSAAEEGTLA